MTNEPSPRPWQIDDGEIVDADGLPITPVDDGAHISNVNMRLIVDAVNERAKFEEARMEFPDLRPVIIAAGQRDAAIAERDRLRDIVRDALPFIEGAIDGVSMILGDAEMSKAVGEYGAPPKDVLEAFVADGRRVIREAKSAIGDNK